MGRPLQYHGHLGVCTEAERYDLLNGSRVLFRFKVLNKNTKGEFT